MRTIFVTSCVFFCASLSACHPHFYNPYLSLFDYRIPYLNNYAYSNNLQYSPSIPKLPNVLHHDSALASYLALPGTLPPLNLLAELPYSVRNIFTTVPMLVVSKNNMKTISKGEIMTVSKKKPEMTLKTERNDILQCTPAVKVILDNPVVVYSLKSSIVFPAEIEIIHDGYRIPIRVGSVLAPVPQNTFVSLDSPISVDLVYALPAEPVHIDYVNYDQGVIINTDRDAVVVESEGPRLPPKNVTIIDFPEAEAEPILQVDEEDDELVNRNPPIVLAPAGIVQSTQPHTSVEPFTNSKESPLLQQLREEALKKRI